MKIGILSDIHGNERALLKCLDYLNEVNVDAYCFLGDYIGELPGIQVLSGFLVTAKHRHRV